MSDEGDAVFSVTGIKRVICAFDEDFGPLNKTGGEEPGDHADQHFLKKGGVHRPFFWSKSNAIPRGRVWELGAGQEHEHWAEDEDEGKVGEEQEQEHE